MKKAILIAAMVSQVMATSLFAEDKPTTGTTITISIKELNRALRDGNKDYEGKDLIVTGWYLPLLRKEMHDWKEVMRIGNLEQNGVPDNNAVVSLTMDEFEDQAILAKPVAQLLGRLVFNHVRLAERNATGLLNSLYLVPNVGFSVTDSQAPSSEQQSPAP